MVDTLSHGFLSGGAPSSVTINAERIPLMAASSLEAPTTRSREDPS